ncbi:hypothetical protein [Nitriliruptor alkaliphilus]|uniref:hypothetical protein n=1 Tax=Nitriliruptor alkaliphilus TaxID=427918 RepID=UPI0006960DE6|nr:hypothetical protein [Nitriliruptor alkaliphilus]
MENLPPRPWSELVGKDDLDPVKGDVAVLKADVAVLKTDVAELRSDVGGLRSEIRAEFAHLRETLDLRFAVQDARLEAFVRERVDAQTKLLVLAFVGALLTTAGIAIGAVAI